MKIEKNSVIGIVNMAIFALFGILGVSGGVLKYVLFSFLYLAFAAAVFLGMSYAVEGSGKEKQDGRFFWCDLLPFAVLLIIARLIAGWDIYIIFYCLGMIYTVINEVSYRVKSQGMSFRDKPLYRVVAIGASSIFLYIILALTGGSPV